MKQLLLRFLFFVGFCILSTTINSGFPAYAGTQKPVLQPEYFPLNYKFPQDTVWSLNKIGKGGIFSGDTLRLIRQNRLAGIASDINFSYEKYAEFLLYISDTSKFIVVPINEFRKIHDKNKIVIGLRHDVDVDLYKALDFSKIESQLGFRSTYYILHTADYYLANTGNKGIHNPAILQTLRTMQNESHFEIGWHNDLVTLQMVYDIDPVNFLHQELNWLRSNGISIRGTSSHGSNYCYTYNYMNYYFFNECTYPIVKGFENNIEVQVDHVNKVIKKGSLKDFGLDYEAYFLDNNKYYSDAQKVNGLRWNFSMLDLKTMVPGDRVIFLTHPIHWDSNKTPTLKVALQNISIPENEHNDIQIPLVSNLKWTAGSDQAWLHIVNGSGEGNHIIYAKAASNPSIHSRTAHITIKAAGVQNQTISVAQQGASIEQDPILAGHLLVYPNPSNGFFYINAGDKKFTSGTITISTLSGKIVFQQNVPDEPDHEIHLPGINSGTYLVKFKSRKLERTGKIVVKK